MTKIHLSVPMYGDIYYRTCKSLIDVQSAFVGDYSVFIDFNGTSALPFNFNRLVMGAYHSDCDYWCLLHSDLGAKERDWLPILLRDMKEEGLSVISAVAAIKNMDGLTSVALDTRDKFPRRLTLTEIRQGPEVLTNDKAKRIYGAPLLINTGMMVWDMKVMREHIPSMPFEFHDGWHYQMTDQGFKMVPWFKPEDWLMSQRLNERGIPYGCTRRVATIHKGSYEFDSSEVWGSAKDLQWELTKDAEHRDRIDS